MPISEARYKKAWDLNSGAEVNSSSGVGETPRKSRIKGKQTLAAAASSYTSDIFAEYLTDWNTCMAGLQGFFKSHNLAAMLHRCAASGVQKNSENASHLANYMLLSRNSSKTFSTRIRYV